MLNAENNGFHRRSRANQPPRFAAGDVITNGGTYCTVEYITKNSYKLDGFRPEYMPVSLVDKYWTLADETIVED